MSVTTGKQTTQKERVSRPLGKPAANVDDKKRRKLIKQLAVGSAALAGYSFLPEKWTAPLVEFGALPVHAVTSGTIADSASAAEEDNAAAQQENAEPSQSNAPGWGTNDFNLVFKMTNQSCASCGIWFDSAQLVVAHSEGTFTKSQTGSLLIKKASNKQGYFRADLSSIPAGALIESAVLYMQLNPHEGIANSDSGGVIEVYDATTGSHVRTITAGRDIKGRGYSKANPTVPIDFTDYARLIHGD